jgi:hypothetical protein
MARTRSYLPTAENLKRIAAHYAALEDVVRRRNKWPSSRPVTQNDMVEEAIIRVPDRDRPGHEKALDQSKLSRLKNADKITEPSRYPGEPSVLALLKACIREGVVPKHTELSEFIGTLVPPAPHSEPPPDDDEEDVRAPMQRRETPVALRGITRPDPMPTIPQAAADAMAMARNEPWWNDHAIWWMPRKLVFTPESRTWTFGQWYNEIQLVCLTARHAQGISDSIRAMPVAKPSDEDNGNNDK